jgi:hypothetical protein
MLRLAFSIGLMLWSAPLVYAQNPKTAEDYNNRGLERQAKGDIAGAIEDYTAAIAHTGRPDT